VSDRGIGVVDLGGKRVAEVVEKQVEIHGLAGQGGVSDPRQLQEAVDGGEQPCGVSHGTLEQSRVRPVRNRSDRLGDKRFEQAVDGGQRAS